jgi:hypothetical protein
VRERKKDLTKLGRRRREKKGMGNCFSSCFPKKKTLFRRGFEASEEEDPETVALREESEKREAELARRHAAEAAARREKLFASSSLGKAIKKSELKAKREREEKERAGFTETRRAEQNAKDWLS